MKKYFKIFLISMLIGIASMAFNTAYAEETWLASKTDVPDNKVWTVKFNKPIKSLDSIKDKISIMGSDGQDIEISVSKGLSDSEVKVAPLNEPYLAGETYILNVANGIESSDGKALENSIKMPFTIAEEAPEETPEESSASSDPYQEIGNVGIKINKIEQDTDSLRLYITYTNKSNEEVSSGDCLSKIVSNHKQYSYITNFNFERYYEKNITAPDLIKPNTSADSVIFFKPIANVDKINIVLDAGLKDYRFYNMVVDDKAKGQLTPEAVNNLPVIAASTINGITINVNKVVQDSDSLKLYVTYINNTKNAISADDAMAKITVNGKQYEYNSEFNVERYYGKNVPKADALLEKSVIAESVVFFQPIDNISSVDVVLSANLKNFTFDNISVEKQ